MAESAAPTPAAERKTGCRKRLWVPAGCLVAVLLVCCCAPIGGLGWLYNEGVRFEERQAREDRDRLFDEALGRGNVEELIDRADARLRDGINREAIRAFVAENPGLLRVDNLVVTNRLFLKRKGEVWWRFTISLGGERSLSIYCVETPEGRLALVGISPGLDRLVPINELNDLEIRNARPRRHHWFD